MRNKDRNDRKLHVGNMPRTCVHGVGRAVVIIRVIGVMHAVSDAIIWLDIDPDSLSLSNEPRVGYKLDFHLHEFATCQWRIVGLAMRVLWAVLRRSLVIQRAM